MKLNKIQNFISVFVLVLFAFVLITTQMMTNILARYQTKSNLGDEASVAAFSIDVEILDTTNEQYITEYVDYEFVPGYELKLDLNLDGSKNETKVRYSVTFETLNNLPLDITHSGVDVKTNGITGTLDPQKSISLSDITISWISNEANNNYKYSGQVDLITIIIVVEQVD